MKKLISIMALALGLAVGLRATVTYNASAKSDNVATFSFNASGTSNTYLVAWVFTRGANLGSIEEVTYAGAGMTQAIATATNTSSVYEFYLAAPASGSNTFSVTFLSSPTAFHIVVGSYDAVSGIGQMASGQPSVNSSMAFGAMSPGSLGVYGSGVNEPVPVGNSPTISVTGLTARQTNQAIYEAYTFGDTTITSSLMFAGADTTGYQLAGTMIELLPAGTPTATSTSTPTSTFTASPTSLSTFTASPTITASPTGTKTFTASPTNTPSPTITASPTNTASPTSTFTITASPTQTSTASATPTPSNSPSPTASPTGQPFPYNSYGQYQSDYAPQFQGNTTLSALTSWVPYPITCTAQPCIVYLANPATTPGQVENYDFEPTMTVTPQWTGVLQPGTVVKLFLNPGVQFFGKAAVTSQAASSLKVERDR